MTRKIKLVSSDDNVSLPSTTYLPQSGAKNLRENDARKMILLLKVAESYYTFNAFQDGPFWGSSWIWGRA